MKALIIGLCLFAGLTFAQEVKSLSVVSDTITANFNIGNKEILAIHDVDGSFAGTEITLYASTSATGNFAPVNFDGTVQTYTVSAGFYFVPNPQAVASILFLKIHSDASETTTYNIIVGDVIGD